MTRFPLCTSYDRGLASLCDRAPSHAFLRNRAANACYVYLMDYVDRRCRLEFGRHASEISLLDWGCGKGQCTYLLGKHGLQVTACDVAVADESPVLQSQAIPVFQLSDPVVLPFDSGSFDAVLSVGVLEHVPDDAGSLREIHRVLKPRGLFFCFHLPFTGSWTQFIAHRRGNYYHDRLYTKRKVKRLLAGSEFDLLDFWHRQLLPKNRVRYPLPGVFEILDRSLVAATPLRFLATNIEFVAQRRS